MRLATLTALFAGLLLTRAAFAADPPTPEQLKRANQVIDAALADERPALKSLALGALGASHRPDAKEKLLAALGDDEGKTRYGGAQGLRFLADASTSPQIVVAWRKEKGWAVKKELCAAAGATGARDLVPDLKAAWLYETQPDVKEAIAFALEDLGEADAKGMLTQLGDPERKKIVKDGTDSWSRHVLEGKKQGDARVAVRTLAFMGMREDLPLIVKQLDSKDADTRLWAAAAIVRLAQ